MKRIFAFCLFVGLLGACTEENSVKLEEDVNEQNSSGVWYKNKVYLPQDEDLQNFITPQSVIVKIDFEDYSRLFDNETLVRDFLMTAYGGKFHRSYNNALNGKLQQNPNESQVPVGVMSKQKKKPDGSAKIENTIYDFELAIIDTFCSGYPAQAWYVNLPAYPSGTIPSLVQTVGYFANSFEFAVPAGGSIALLYYGVNSPSQSCQSYVYFATATGCRETIFPLCPLSYRFAPANRLQWSVDIGS